MGIAADTRTTTILAEGCSFKGEIQIQGIFRVEGEYDGTVRTPDQLVVGKTGVVRGDIHVKNAIIAGRVVGNITADAKIELQSGCHVEGDIRTRRLIIDEGVFFEGNCSMGAASQERAPSKRRESRRVPVEIYLTPAVSAGQVDRLLTAIDALMESCGYEMGATMEMSA